MGLILVFFLAAGVCLGLLVSAAGVAGGLLLAGVNSRRRKHVWAVAGCVAPTVLAVVWLTAWLWPKDWGAPGSDYDLVLRNYLILGAVYAGAPGVGALAAGLSAFFCPRRDAASIRT